MSDRLRKLVAAVFSLAAPYMRAGGRFIGVMFPVINHDGSPVDARSFCLCFHHNPGVDMSAVNYFATKLTVMLQRNTPACDAGVSSVGNVSLPLSGLRITGAR